MHQVVVVCIFARGFDGFRKEKQSSFLAVFLACGFFSKGWRVGERDREWGTKMGMKPLEALRGFRGLSWHLCGLRGLEKHTRGSNRVFLNLWFAKPMVCVRVAFHENDFLNLWFACESPFTENDGNHAKMTKMKTNQTAKNKELSAGFAEITETTKMTKTT